MLQKFDSRNKDIKVFVKDGLYHRNDAKVSVFDSVVQGGDAVWEGMRVYNGHIFMEDKHLDRLFYSAGALAFQNIPSREFVKKAIRETLEANGMHTDTHIRLTLTRGEKITSGMDPRLNQKGCTLVVLAEWKPPVYDNEKGIRVISCHINRNAPKFLDSKIHHNNLLNNILAKIQANISGCDDALMLDEHGFVAELNATNIFMVKNDTLYTPHADACLNGITRGLVLELAEKINVKAVEKNLSLSEFYGADEVFASGTMGELTPVFEIDGRQIVNKTNNKVLPALRKAFEELIQSYHKHAQ